MIVRKLAAAVRVIALVSVLVLTLAFSGCSSCKDFEVQIAQLDAQIALLQKDLVARDDMIKERDQIAAELTDSLAVCRSEKAVLVEKSQEVVMISIPDQVAFPAGGVQVLDAMVPTLQAIAAAVRLHPDWDVLVEGYTDSKELDDNLIEYYPTKWELGAARACAVVRYLTTDLALPADRFGAVSYGHFRPVGDNETKDGRAQNRFVRLMMRKSGT